MSDNTSLGDRMKRYENAYRLLLPRRSYVLMRLDGWAFHSYLSEAAKPFDFEFMEQMNAVAMRLLEMIPGAQFAYLQSDEISILVTDFETTEIEPWFANNLNKLLTIPAGFASGYLAQLRYFHGRVPAFDNRAWVMSDPVEVANYFLWRQRDAVRNSIQRVGQAHFSRDELFMKTGDQVQEMLFTQHKVNWNDFPASCKRGTVVARIPEEGWAVLPAPHFRAAPDSFLAEVIPRLPTLG